MKVIGVTGLPGSGKSLLFEKSKEKGAVVVSMGDIVREKAAERGEDSGTTARKLREENGQYIVAKLTIEKIKEFLEKQGNVEIILVEGIRSPYEVEMFDANFDEFTSVSLYASPKTRFKRVSLRKRDDDSSVYEDFKERDQRELDLGIGEVIATADYLIKNDDSFEEYEEQVVKFLEKEMV